MGVVTSTEHFFSGELTVHMLFFYKYDIFNFMAGKCLHDFFYKYDIFMAGKCLHEFFSDIILVHAFFWQ